MKHLAASIGSVVYPLLTAFTLLGSAACTDDTAPAGGDDTMDPGTDPGTPDPGMPDPTPSAPAAGTLDTTFGTDGIVTLPVGAGYAASLAVQGDKLLACFTSLDGAQHTARVVRLNLDGSIDGSFGVEGRVVRGNTGMVNCNDILVDAAGTLMLSTADYTGGGYWSTFFVADDGSKIGTSEMGSNFGMSRLSTYSGPNKSETYAGWVKNGDVYINMLQASVNYFGHYTNKVSSVARVFSLDGNELTIVATDTATKTWEVLRGSMLSNQLAPLGNGANAAAGTSAQDILVDAMFLGDGSVLAFGSMDSDKEVMAARFVMGAAPTVDVEHHAPAGGVAYARDGVLDTHGGAVLVGSQHEAGGNNVFAWQRYLPNSVTLDTAYQHAGVGSVAAPSGSGELISAVEYNGAIYALGSYDVETASPKIALIKIVE